MSNFSFSVPHLFQFQFWPHRRCHSHPASACPCSDFMDMLRRLISCRIIIIIIIISPISDHWRQRYDVLSIFKMAAAVAQFYYRQVNSIHGWDITISVLQKQTSAILKFFFRFWLWPHHRNLHGFLHKVAKLHPYRNAQCGNVTL